MSEFNTHELLAQAARLKQAFTAAAPPAQQAAPQQGQPPPQDPNAAAQGQPPPQDPNAAAQQGGQPQQFDPAAVMQYISQLGAGMQQLMQGMQQMQQVVEQQAGQLQEARKKLAEQEQSMVLLQKMIDQQGDGAPEMLIRGQQMGQQQALELLKHLQQAQQSNDTHGMEMQQMAQQMLQQQAQPQMQPQALPNGQ